MDGCEWKKKGWLFSCLLGLIPSNVFFRIHSTFPKLTSPHFHPSHPPPGFKALRTLTSSSLSYLHTTNIKKWDICAPDALVSISGGRTSDLNGSPIGYSDPHKVVNQAGLLVTNKRSRYSHDELLRKLRWCFCLHWLLIIVQFIYFHSNCTLLLRLMVLQCIHSTRLQIFCLVELQNVIWLFFKISNKFFLYFNRISVFFFNRFTNCNWNCHFLKNNFNFFWIFFHLWFFKAHLNPSLPSLSIHHPFWHHLNNHYIQTLSPPNHMNTPASSQTTWTPLRHPKPHAHPYVISNHMHTPTSSQTTCTPLRHLEPHAHFIPIPIRASMTFFNNLYSTIVPLKLIFQHHFITNPPSPSISASTY